MKTRECVGEKREKRTCNREKDELKHYWNGRHQHKQKCEEKLRPKRNI